METFNTEENFWSAHPALKVAGPFKELYTKDKTKNKAGSSKLAWSVKLIWDRKSEFYKLPEKGEDNKIELIFTDFYGDPRFYKNNTERVDGLKDFYIKISQSVAARTLTDIENKLLERSAFLKNTVYDMGVVSERGAWIGNTVDTLDKMMANTQKMYDLYDKARKTVMEEESQRVMGDATESLSDKGEM